MKEFKLFALSAAFYFIDLTISAQTLQTIDTLETQSQNCLDKGQYMLGCSERFYSQMDSLLNIRYKKLRSMCDSVQKENLKDEQLEWLQKRDRKFRQNQTKVNKEAKEGGYDSGQDESMILTETNAKYVKQRVIELINSSPHNYSANVYKVNPTGIYMLESRTETKDGETYGYFGDIAVKKISTNKIVVHLYVCKGAPSYNSGSLTDTLIIINNKAVYKNAEYDSSCRITFIFFRQGIKVEEKTNDYNFGCGFGHAVIANGYFRRKSYKTPTTKELTEE